MPIFAIQFERKGNDSLAQQVEHNTFNVGVLGSSPRRITKEQLRNGLLFLLYFESVFSWARTQFPLRKGVRGFGKGPKVCFSTRAPDGSRKGSKKAALFSYKSVCSKSARTQFPASIPYVIPGLTGYLYIKDFKF